MRLLRKDTGPEMVDIILMHTTVDDDRPAIITRAKIPFEDARAHMGARGFYVNFLVNWPFIMSLGIGLLFVVWEVALLVIGGITNPLAMLPYLVGSAAIGGGLGYGLGKLTRGFILTHAPEKSYHAWAEYDPAVPVLDKEGQPLVEDGKPVVVGKNRITPMDYELASMLAMNTAEQQAYLQAIGLVSAQRGNESAAPDPTMLLAGAAPVFTAKGFANALKVDTAKRVMARSKGKENFLKTASIATIALGFMAITVVAGITMLGGDDGPTTPPPSDNQDVSDVREQP